MQRTATRMSRLMITAIAVLAAGLICMAAAALPAKAYADTSMTGGATALAKGSVSKLKGDFDGTFVVYAAPIAGATKYEYQLATNKKFKRAVKSSLASNAGIFCKKLTKKGYKGFKNGLSIYVRVRGVNTATGVAGAWSKGKKIKIKNKTYSRSKSKLPGVWLLDSGSALLTLNKSGTGSFAVTGSSIPVGWCASSAAKGKATLMSATPGSGKVVVSKNGKTLVLKDSTATLKFKRVK